MHDGRRQVCDATGGAQTCASCARCGSRCVSLGRVLVQPLPRCSPRGRPCRTIIAAPAAVDIARSSGTNLLDLNITVVRSARLRLSHRGRPSEFRFYLTSAACR
jgi:hypothetical protein